MSSATPSKAARIWKRTWIGASMIGVLAALFALVEATQDALPILMIAALLSAVAVYELDRISALGRGGWVHRVGPAFVVMIVLSAMALRGTSPGGEYDFGPPWTSQVQATFLAAAALAIVRGSAPVMNSATSSAPSTTPVHASRWREVVSTALVAIWVACPLFLLVPLWQSFGLGGLIALIVLSKVGDIAGYYVGNAMGRSHPFPRISPGKTTAGCFASLLAGVVAGIALVATDVLPAPHFGLFGAALAGAVINLASQAGDLLESWVKRLSGAKDSGPWFGPAGGVLDLVDSLLLSVPTALLIWPLLFTP